MLCVSVVRQANHMATFASLLIHGIAILISGITYFEVEAVIHKNNQEIH